MTRNASSPPWRVGIDVGGTFTDLVVADSEGRTAVFKVPSVPEDPGEGVVAGLRKAADSLNLHLLDFLGQVEFFLHGSTVATNTLLEGRGARVGLLTTRGFRDSLEARRGLRKNPWDHRTPFPPVLVPRYLRRPVSGRIGSDGLEIEPLRHEDVREACRIFRDEGVDSIAVCFLNSFIDPTHERKAGEVLKEQAVCDSISLSSEIAPIMGEYERCSTTVVNAYVKPRVATYLQALRERLVEMGLRTEVLMLQSNGGASSLGGLVDVPVNLLLSGPSAGVGAMRHLAAAIGEGNLVSMEIGGTSCDVMLMNEGRVALTDSLSVNDYDLVTPSVDIHTVGAGGGTLAGIDGAGLMYAGPEGAGARPGPASYGLGGTRPTVTDANLVLGRLRPGPYADGSVTLDLAAAAAAIDREIADPLGISRTEAAAGVIRIVEQNLLHAVERISIQRGYNPRQFVLVACGGAGPMHGSSVGRNLGAKAVYAPRQAGAFCAIGMQYADVRRDFVQVLMSWLDDDVEEAIRQGYGELENRVRDALDREGFSQVDLEYELDLHYEGQQWDVRVPVRPDAGPNEIRKAFESEYDRQFGHTNPEGRINIAKLRISGIGRLPDLLDPAVERYGTPATPIEIRPVYAADTGAFVDTPVYSGTDLQYGHSLDGPAVIEEETTTILVGQRDHVSVDKLNNYLISLGGE